MLSRVFVLLLSVTFLQTSDAFAKPPSELDDDNFQILGDKIEPDLQIEYVNKRRRCRKRLKKCMEVNRKNSATSTNSTPTEATKEYDDNGAYTWEVSLLSDLSSVTNSEGGGSSGQYLLNGRALYIIADSIELGGELDYWEVTVKGEDSESVNTNYVFSLLGVYNFGNINTDQTVFFIGAGFGFGSSSSTSKSGDEETESKSGLTRLSVALGLHYFVDSNVALTGQISYDSDSLKPDEGDGITQNTIHFAEIGFSLFI